MNSPLKSADEIFDVVDEQDCVLRQEIRSTVHDQNLLHRAVHILIFNSAGELLLQKRSALKDLHPHLWVTSCSGHVDAGETYEKAAEREIREELGLTDSPSLHPLFKLSPTLETGWEFVWVYRATHEGPFTPSPVEVAALQFFSASEINRWIETKPEELTPSFLFIWKKYLGRKN